MFLLKSFNLYSKFPLKFFDSFGTIFPFISQRLQFKKKLYWNKTCFGFTYKIFSNMFHSKNNLP